MIDSDVTKLDINKQIINYHIIIKNPTPGY